MTEADFQAILSDESKTIVGDLSWNPDEDHSPALEFRQRIECQTGYPLFIRGSLNSQIGTLSFTVIHQAYGRICGLDLGKRHRNPDGSTVGLMHKHSWRGPIDGAKYAYEPSFITGTASKPVLVWREFCEQAKISHQGRLLEPPPHQPMLF
jgi:hypothetical protein